MKFIKPDDGELFAVCDDEKNIIRVTGDYYAMIEGNDIISEYGDYIGNISRDNTTSRLCVISEDGDLLFIIQ